MPFATLTAPPVSVRFRAPARAAIDAAVHARPPLSQWRQFDSVLRGSDWPDVAALNALAAHAPSMPGAPGAAPPRFVAQTPELLRDGLHYETRIAERGAIATREGNWHDLLNALVWLRYPALKQALNARQCAEIARVGTKQRSRAQCALTHFDEAGIVVVLRDLRLLALWDAHDWHGLFWRERAAWHDGRIEAAVFGHALLEHALAPQQLLVGKALVVMRQSGNVESCTASMAAAIRRGELLGDPQELRPLPLSGIPGWHAQNAGEPFYREAACFRPLRAGRRYAPPLAAPQSAPASAAASARAQSPIGPA